MYDEIKRRDLLLLTEPSVRQERTAKRLSMSPRKVCRILRLQAPSIRTNHLREDNDVR